MNRYIVFFFVFGCFISSCQSRQDKIQKEAVQIETNDLPQITLMVNGQSPLSAKTLSGKVILIFFQPDCDHCQREAKEIRENLASFSDYKIYFITTDTFDATHRFSKEYNLSDIENVHFAQTTLETILNTVGPISAPSMFIYSNKKLVKHFDGETPIAEILKHIQINS